MTRIEDADDWGLEKTGGSDKKVLMGCKRKKN